MGVLKIVAMAALGLLSGWPLASARAMEVSVLSQNHTMVFVINGEIEPGDADKFARIFDEKADAFRFIVALDSRGGSFLEAMKLGQVFRNHGIHTQVQKYSPRPPMQDDWEYSTSAKEIPDGECYSACALAFMGGLERTVPETGKLGFNQFSVDGTAANVQETTQSVSALVSSYLRIMGADPKLFELMSATRPSEKFVPTVTELGTLNIVPSPDFKDFKLQPKDKGIVATAVNPINNRGLEKVYQLEFFCWKGKPMVNLYAEKTDQGLPPQWIAQSDGTWNLALASGDYAYNRKSISFYPDQRLLATLTFDRRHAREASKGSFSFNVDSTTVSGLFMGATIHAPDGDAAIAASWQNCL